MSPLMRDVCRIKKELHRQARNLGRPLTRFVRGDMHADGTIPFIARNQDDDQIQAVVFMHAGDAEVRYTFLE